MAKYVYDGPEQFRPLSAWAYFGWGILFSIPIVGFILLIIFSVKDDNINLRNYARSYWCVYVVIVVVVLICMVAGISLAGMSGLMSGYNM